MLKIVLLPQKNIIFSVKLFIIKQRREKEREKEEESMKGEITPNPSTLTHHILYFVHSVLSCKYLSEQSDILRVTFFDK